MEAETTRNADKALPAVTVIAPVPVPGVEQPLRELSGNYQTISGEQIRSSQVFNISEFLNRDLGSVHVNDIQGNPFQVDLNYRGFTASPLLGTSQGLSVYVDGVRMNQPFGDVVSWDLIPKNAIRSVTLVPGSNPLFGLNTLGGAISMQTKSGLSNPGGSGQVTAGSFGRNTQEFEYGGSNDNGLNWFISGAHFQENGWRVASPTQVTQLFNRTGWKDARNDIALTISVADSAMTGNGLQEQRMLAKDYRSVYTKPDETGHRALALNLIGKHEVNDSLTVSGNAYYRYLKTSTFNGDINEGSLDQNVYLSSTSTDRSQLTDYKLPTSSETSANTPFPYLRCIAQARLNDEPGEKCNGLINRTSTKQHNFGFSSQFTLLQQWMGKTNQFVGGAGYDGSTARFSQSTQIGYLNPDRSITGIPYYADGVTGGDVDGIPFDNRVNLRGRTDTFSLFATDTLEMNERTFVTASARYNLTKVNNTDYITPTGADSLSGVHQYQRLNPSVGVSYIASQTLTTYAGYSEGSRAPTPIELGCANPDNPCKLPNSMAGDPPLRQIVAKTFEAGLRGQLSSSTNWTAGVFRTTSHDDILFVAAPIQQSFGYFKNFGETRRQGIELGVDTNSQKWTLSTKYTYIDATFQSEAEVGGTGNSSNNAGNGLEGEIDIKKGNKIPLIPEHMLKARADHQIDDKWGVGVSMIAMAGVYARGNENNEHQRGGRYLGEGKTDAYALFNLNARYKPEEKITLFIQVNNLFDTRYYTSAQLGPTGFDANGNFVARPYLGVGSPTKYPVTQATFYAPGAPRAIWIGMRYEFDRPKR
ncbi:MAG: TonB-dependent receptor [Oxalobacteraceae bacterium]|nr:TonB-dependent receptor [Oxalobacteraceae bacterium]